MSRQVDLVSILQLSLRGHQVEHLAGVAVIIPAQSYPSRAMRSST